MARSHREILTNEAWLNFGSWYACTLDNSFPRLERQRNVDKTFFF